MSFLILMDLVQINSTLLATFVFQIQNTNRAFRFVLIFYSARRNFGICSVEKSFDLRITDERSSSNLVSPECNLVKSNDQVGLYVYELVK